MRREVAGNTDQRVEGIGVAGMSRKKCDGIVTERRSGPMGGVRSGLRVEDGGRAGSGDGLERVFSALDPTPPPTTSERPFFIPGNAPLPSQFMPVEPPSLRMHSRGWRGSSAPPPVGRFRCRCYSSHSRRCSYSSSVSSSFIGPSTPPVNLDQESSIISYHV